MVSWLPTPVGLSLTLPGSPVRIGPDTVATDDPVIQRHMAAPRSPWRKGRWFRGMKFDPRLDNLLSMADEDAHTKLRAKLMPGVCTTSLH